jgi:succinoglycan biosynthesis protein ExoU
MLARRAVLRVIPPQGYIATIRANSLSGRHREEDLRQLRDSNLPLMQLPGLNGPELKALKSSYLSTDCRLQWRELIKAVKQRNSKGLAATFLRSPHVTAYLMGQLASEAIVRARKKTPR